MHALAKEFAAQGHEPTVLVPDDRLERPWRQDTVEGVPVLRLRSLSTRDVRYSLRTVSEVSLPWVMRRGLAASPLAGENWHGVVTYSPSIFFGPLVRQLKRSSRCRAYLIQRDMFPDWAVDVGLIRSGGVVHRAFKWFERQNYESHDIVGVQSPSSAAAVTTVARAPGPRVEVLWNWVADDADIGCSIAFDEPPLAAKRVFVYTGNMGVAQGTDVFIELAARLKSRIDLVFLFVGRGSDVSRLRALAADRRLGNVIFHDEIPPAEIPGLLQRSHVGILALDPRHRSHNIPGKFLAYLQAGLPVLARVNANNDLVGLIGNERVGRVITNNSLDALEKAALQLVDDEAARLEMGERGKALARRLFSPAATVRQIVAALET